MSSLRPEAKSHAVTALTRMPIAATAIIVLPATGSGDPRRRMASHERPPTVTSKKTALNRAARIDEPRMPVSEALGRRTPGEDARQPGDAKSKDVAEIVSGVGQQRHRVAHQAVERFDDDEAEIERDADGEGFAEARRRVGVRRGHDRHGHESGRYDRGTSRSPFADPKSIL